MASVEWVTLSLLFLGVIAGFSQIKHLPQDHRYLAFFILITLILELIADYYMEVLTKNNLYLYHFFIPFQYSALSLFFRENFKSKKIKTIINLSILFVIISSLIISLFLQKLTEMPSWTILITRLLLLIWTLLFLRSLLSIKDLIPLSSIPAFFVCMGVLIYTISLFQMGLMRYLIFYKYELANFWINITLWLDVGFYLLCMFPLLHKAYLKYKGLDTSDRITL